MNTQFAAKKEYADALLEIARNTEPLLPAKPLNFIKVMEENRGSIDILQYPYSFPKDGLDRKNPLAVVLGDSVTAGHFEFAGDPGKIFARLQAGQLGKNDVISIMDARQGYVDQFRAMLIGKYGQTCVSVINSGLAGDVILSMEKRLDRDVIRYQPDLVIVNASLNWPKQCRGTETYKESLLRTVQRLKTETDADIILMTPNMVMPSPPDMDNPLSALADRVNVIREAAEKENLCLADTYRVWERYAQKGFPVSELLANGVNHPCAEGHTACAITLMKLFL
ncbi:MAG: GDSL-type esterase/lipase family protein [Clostridiales bacterium]|jgi:lysophospholipase L1-like esterase|nr:GDSL-type esterase/lipase family protein [Clostridiales bacterium]